MPRTVFESRRGQGLCSHAIGGIPTFAEPHRHHLALSTTHPRPGWARDRRPGPPLFPLAPGSPWVASRMA